MFTEYYFRVILPEKSHTCLFKLYKPKSDPKNFLTNLSLAE